MRRKLMILFFVLGGAVHVAAQTGNGKVLPFNSSGKGNYIYLFTPEDFIKKENTEITGTDYFIIERKEYDTANPKQTEYKKIGEARPVQSMNELKRLFTEEKLAQIKQLNKLNDDEALLNYFRKFTGIKDYNLLYGFIETKIALGHVFVDADVKENVLYYYTVTRVLKNKTRASWGYTIMQGKAGNYALPYFKPVLAKVDASDSLVRITWKLAVINDYYNKIAAPVTIFKSDTAGTLKRSYFFPSQLKVTVYESSNGQAKETAKLLPVLNAKGDTASYTYIRKCVPEEPVTAHLVTEDEVYNIGISSDTAFTYAISNKIVPMVYGVRVKSVLNGIELSWNKLKQKPYLAGVEINRYNSRDELDSLTTVAATDTSFTDYKIEPGQTYRYRVKAVYLPMLGVEQKTAAEGVGIFTEFTNPLPPFNVKAENAGKNILLKWEGADEPSLFGYFIYRGTDAEKLDLIAGPVKTKSFEDTSSSLSGRSTYFYSIVAQNLRQDTSEYSPVVSIVPNRKITTRRPDNIEFYYSNDVLRISWEDIRKYDNVIASFLIQKKKKSEPSFSMMSTMSAADNFFEDTAIEEGVVYQYRVAAITYTGDTSDYSELKEFLLPPSSGGIMNVFFVRNIKEGIHISWPQQETDYLYYTIYRRESTKKEFVKLTTVESSKFNFVDRTVKQGVVYVYAITFTNKMKKESVRGKSVSVRRMVNPN